MNVTLKLIVLVLLACFVVTTNAQEQTNDGQFCDICTFVVQEAEQYVNQSEPQIEQALLSACSKLPSTLGNLCNTVVLIYGHQIVDFILTEENPKRICCQLHLCANCTSDAKPIIPEQIVVKPIDIKQSNEGMCDLCTFIVGQVETFLAQNQTEEEIRRGLNLVCSIIPTAFEQQCRNIVNKYVPYIIYYLESEFPPQAVCQQVGICSKKQTQMDIRPVIKKSNDGSCDLCKFGVSQIEAWVASNETETRIQQKLTLVCNLLPGSFKAECLSLVDQVPQVITFLEQTYTPEVICQLIGVCSTKTIPRPVNNKRNEATCDLCKFGVSQIEAWIASEQTQKAIQQRLGLICNMLPAFKSECLGLVEQVPQVITFLEQQYTPDVICQIVGICAKKVLPKPVDKKSNDGTCDLCKFGVSQIEAWVASNETQSRIQQKLTLVCNLLPGSFKAECLSLVDQVPQVITFLEQTYTPEVICQMIGVCSTKNIPKPINKKNDGTCDLCKFGVGQIEAWVASNATEKAIQQRLGLICSIIPIFKAECQDLVAKVPEIIQELEQQYSPDFICQTLRLCSSKDASVAKKSNDGTCDLCKFGISQIEAWVASNETQARITQKLSLICNLLPASFKGQCLSLVDQVPQIITFLEQTYTPEVICQLIGVCSTDAVPKPVYKNDGTCDLCKFGVSQIEAWVASNTTVKAIQQRLNLICSILPILKDQCLSLVDQVPQIIQQLEQQYSPDVICQTLKLCSSRVRPMPCYKKPIKPIIAKKSNDGTCDLCKFGVSQIEAWVASNETQSRIQQKLTLVCNLLPGSFKAECLSLVDQVPQVITFLEQTYTPEVICQMIGVCSTKNVPKPINKKNDGTCDLCKFGVSQIEAWVASNETQTFIQQKLMLVCKLLPGSFKGQCLSLVDQVPQVITFLEQAYTPEVVCQLVGVCPTDKVVPKKNDGTCDLCKFGVSQIEAWIASNTTEKSIQQRLTLICSLLPVFKSECLNLVDQVPQIIQQLEQQYSPDVICQMLKLCASKTAVNKANDGTCDLCKFGVSQIEAWVASNETISSITTRMNAICSLLPGAFRDTCISLVREIPSAVAMLERYYTPEKVCETLRLCSSKRIALPKPVIVKKTNDATCDLCKFGVSQIEAWVASNTTVKVIQQRLSAICSVLPSIFKAECNNLVDQIPTIITYLEQQYTPEAICQLIGVCSNKVLPKPVSNKKNDGPCDLCKFGVSQIEAWIASNETQTLIQQKLSLICKLLPGSFKGQCLSLVDQVPQIITFLEQTYTPEVICQLTGICSTDSVAVVYKKANEDILCPACMLIVGLVEQQVKTNHTVEDVKKALDKVCNKLPHPFSDACNGIIEEYTPQIIDMIVKKLDPSAVCTAIKLCKKKHVVVFSPAFQQLLRARDSTYCPLCMQVAGFLEDQITAQATLEQVINALKQVCEHVPSEVRALCKQVVPAAYQEIIKFILEKEPPKVICQQLQMCSKDEYANLMRQNNLVCDGCKQLVTLADNFITQESTKQEITVVVQNICQFFPDQLVDMCKAMIAQYGPGLIEQLASKVLDPNTVCSAVRACPKAMGLPFSRQSAIMMKFN
jgi:saposin